MQARGVREQGSKGEEAVGEERVPEGTEGEGEAGKMGKGGDEKENREGRTQRGPPRLAGQGEWAGIRKGGRGLGCPTDLHSWRSLVKKTLTSPQIRFRETSSSRRAPSGISHPAACKTSGAHAPCGPDGLAPEPNGRPRRLRS